MPVRTKIPACCSRKLLCILPACRMFGFLFLLFVVYPGIGYTNSPPEYQGKPSTEPTGKNSDLPRKYVLFAKFAEDIRRQKITLLHEVGPVNDLDEITRSIEELAEDSSEFIEGSKEMLHSATTGPREFLNIKTRVQRYRVISKRLNQQLTNDLEKRTREEQIWLSLNSELKDWEQLHESKRLSAVAQSELHDLERNIDVELDLIQGHIRSVLALTKRLLRVDRELFAIESHVDATLKSEFFSGPRQTSPPIFSKEFIRQFNSELWQKLRSSVMVYGELQIRHIWDGNALKMFGFAIVFITAVCIMRLIPKSNHSATMSVMRDRPVSSSFFLTVHFYWLYLLISNSPKPQQQPLIMLILLLAAIRLINVLIIDERAQSFLKQSITFLAIITCLQLVQPPEALIRLFILITTISGIVFCSCHAYSIRKQKEEGMLFYLLVAIAGFLTFIFSLVAVGFDELATQIFLFTVACSIYGVTLWIFYRLLSCLVHVLISSIPLQLVQENIEPVAKYLRPFLLIICTTLFAVFILTKLYFFPNEAAAFHGIMSPEWTIGSLTFYPQLFVKVIVVVYSTVLAAKIIKGILQQVLLPRYKIEEGVQYSIIRLVNYFVLLVAFILMLTVFGIELTKLTIFGSALGIGVGFGLQAIVNNFASGLILLFERPLKIGDTVEIDNDIGVVKRLGLRSTIIQTHNNAEIVVPNSNLITGKVTNWTLTKKHFRLDITIGAAYGSNVDQVLEILKNCGDEHPLVMSQPPPQPLFIGFGESSLDFELRVWLRDYSLRFEVLSELNRDIESEFSIQGVQIPFPQRDIHIKSRIPDKTCPDW